MAVKVGSARSDENGGAYNGKAGDQKSGKEVSTQNWYLHSKGWRVFRAKDPQKALMIAKSMQDACDNNKIGYDQWQRNTLYTQAEKVGFDVSKVTTACETDCSALVRVNCAYAGIMGLPSDFRTGNMPENLMSTGAFVELEGTKYTENDDYLGKGDILVTKRSGHTVVVLSNGKKYDGSTTSVGYVLGERTLRKGDEGSDVKTLQQHLMSLGYSLGKYGADGDFGSATEGAVEKFQKDQRLEVDGIYGEKSHAALMKALPTPEPEPAPAPTPAPETPVSQEPMLEVTGGSVRIRKGDSTNYDILTTVNRGDKLVPVLDKNNQPIISSKNWYATYRDKEIGWISGTYIKIV